MNFRKWLLTESDDLASWYRVLQEEPDDKDLALIFADKLDDVGDTFRADIIRRHFAQKGGKRRINLRSFISSFGSDRPVIRIMERGTGRSGKLLVAMGIYDRHLSAPIF